VFHFPKNQELKKQWVQQVSRTRDVWNGPTSCSVVCSAHFVPECFENDLALYSSFGLSKKRKLKPNSVPTIFKRKIDDDSLSPGSLPKQRRLAYNKRERQRVDKLFLESCIFSL
jgi:hypothetical protein